MQFKRQASVCLLPTAHGATVAAMVCTNARWEVYVFNLLALSCYCPITVTMWRYCHVPSYHGCYFEAAEVSFELRLWSTLVPTMNRRGDP